jgi:putative endonuclease
MPSSRSVSIRWRLLKHPSDNAAKGRLGEDRASEFLADCGYRVLARNVRVPGGEIDAVCLDGPTLVIVEVKRRDTRTFGSALRAVNARKRATLRRIAADYAQIVAPSANIRFDVVTLDGARLSLHRNAF